MASTISLNDALRTFDQMSPEDQEALIDVLRRRQAVRTREQIVQDLEESRRDIAVGNYTKGSADDLMRELTS